MTGDDDVVVTEIRTTRYAHALDRLCGGFCNLTFGDQITVDLSGKMPKEHVSQHETPDTMRTRVTHRTEHTDHT